MLRYNCRSIDLHTKEVTNEGIRYLCDSDVPHGPNGEEYGKCKKLTHLDVDGNVSTDGVVTALANLPNLVYLISDYLYEGLVKYVEMNKSVKLKLQYLEITCELDDENCVKNEVVLSVVSAVPDIRKLKIDNMNIVEIDAFLKLKCVSALSFSMLTEVPSSSIQLVTTHFSDHLTELKIDYYDDDLDISVIGYHCTKLQHLYWDSNCVENCKYKLVPLVHFSKIVKAEFDDANLSDFTIPESAVECILTSPNLKSFSLANYPVHNDVFQLIVKKARMHTEIFSNLQELSLSCQISSLSAKQIICLAPKLTKLTVEDYIVDDCLDFVLQNDLNHCEINTREY